MNPDTLIRKASGAIAHAPVFLLAIFLSCMFPLKVDGPSEPFQFAIAGAATDTISPFGPLVLTFSRPVIDPDSVRFNFSPPFTERHVLRSSSTDTVMLYFALPLEGNVKYRLWPGTAIQSIDGGILSPGEDTLSFVTHYREQEPNDSKVLADSLRGTVFGQVATANDTDCFIAADAEKRAFYLRSTGSTSTFSIRDNKGVVVKPHTYAVAETLTIPMDFALPLSIRVCAYNHSNGGSYELGWVKR